MSNNSLNILVPNLPESVTDAIVAVWHKKEGDTVQLNEILLEIETDKIMLEVPSPKQGILEKILEQVGAVVVSGQILGNLKWDDFITDQNHTNFTIHDKKNIKSHTKKNTIELDQHIDNTQDQSVLMSPSIRKLINEHNLDIKNIKGSGIKGRITRKDVEILLKQSLSMIHKNNYLDNNILHHHVQENNIHNHDNTKKCNMSSNTINRTTQRIIMSRLRKTMSERLLNVTNSTAMLTTFNEVNMQPVMILRNKYKDLFQQRYQIKLGFLSFYIKAVLEGLRKFPEINASIDRDEIVYYNYFDISIAVATERGLVTPVLKDIDTLNISNIEKKIKYLVEKSRNGKLTLEELKGGTFTITNGGIFGSLISTPIINPPQSAILGIHVIKDRPIVVNKEIVIAPMMYIALSYDHRLIDGKDAVNFLVVVKDLIEDPIRLLLDI